MSDGRITPDNNVGKRMPAKAPLVIYNITDLYKDPLARMINQVNSAEADMRSRRQSIDSRANELKRFNSERTKLDVSSVELRQRQSRVAEELAEQEAIREEIKTCRALLDRKTAEVIQRTKITSM